MKVFRVEEDQLHECEDGEQLSVYETAVVTLEDHRKCLLATLEAGLKTLALENERLRSALKPFAEYYANGMPFPDAAHKSAYDVMKGES